MEIVLCKLWEALCCEEKFWWGFFFFFFPTFGKLSCVCVTAMERALSCISGIPSGAARS